MLKEIQGQQLHHDFTSQQNSSIVQLLLDLTLANYRWYRRLQGNSWWQVEISLFDDSQIFWVRHMPECKCCIIQTEQY
ncbi:hypothetical protein [Nodularia sp. NIES-3585]|uniref:hypothetical protein n=1 Tax=Nodularia sp. NIES-3585 TaxID=1973477 RepID=UPI000B5C3722|nr:hypothetical protein [Nodularia sp. NIES-3585]